MNNFIYDIKENEGDILIVSGDLTCNSEQLSHEALLKKSKNLEENGTSVFVIPGNHDIKNPWARSFKDEKQYLTESISPKGFADSLMMKLLIKMKIR